MTRGIRLEVVVINIYQNNLVHDDGDDDDLLLVCVSSTITGQPQNSVFIRRV